MLNFPSAICASIQADESAYAHTRRAVDLCGIADAWTQYRIRKNLFCAYVYRARFHEFSAACGRNYLNNYVGDNDSADRDVISENTQKV